jgi:hypothetical protein
MRTAEKQIPFSFCNHSCQRLILAARLSKQYA